MRKHAEVDCAREGCEGGSSVKRLKGQAARHDGEDQWRGWWCERRVVSGLAGMGAADAAGVAGCATGKWGRWTCRLRKTVARRLLQLWVACVAVGASHTGRDDNSPGMSVVSRRSNSRWRAGSGCRRMRRLPQPSARWCAQRAVKRSLDGGKRRARADTTQTGVGAGGRGQRRVPVGVLLSRWRGPGKARKSRRTREMGLVVQCAVGRDSFKQPRCRHQPAGGTAACRRW